MSLEDALERNTAALIALTTALTANSNGVAAAPAAPAEPAKPRGRPPRTAPAPEAPQTQTAELAASPTPAAPTYEETAKAITSVVSAKGRAVAVNILTDFGAARLFDVKPEQYAEVIAKCQAALADAAIV